MTELIIARRWLYGFGILIFLPIIYWCGFYLLHEHPFISEWYLSLGKDPFVQADTFSTRFFTPEVKSEGNHWCILALAFSCASIIAITISWRKKCDRNATLSLPKWTSKNTGYSIALLMVTLLLWLFGNHELTYQPDELYSANNIASMHPFQALSYYMDVNNHLLFNQINCLLFHNATDKTQTGRIVSLLAYLATALLVFHLIFCFIRSKPTAFCASLLMITHMTVWGWAISGRGYALYTMAAWLCVVACYHYYHRRKGFYLLLLLCGTFIGYTTLPTFLYFHPALILAAIILQWKERHIDYRFWKYQLVAGILIFLFYVPCLSISGLAAITSNRHVPKPESYGILAWDMYRYFRYYLNTLFLGEPHRLLYIVYGLFLLPVVTIFRKRDEQLVGIFYTLMWGAVVTISFVIKTFTAPRTLSPQLHLSFGLTLLTIYFLLKNFLKFTTEKRINLIFRILCIATAVCLLADNSSHIALTLYGQ